MIHRPAYIPLHALREIDIKSILSVAFPFEIDNDENKRRYDEIKRQYDYHNKIYDDLKTKPEPYQVYYQGQPQVQHRAENPKKYWEENYAYRPGPTKSQKYIEKYRKDGFKPDELKLYWNYQEIESLHKKDYFNPTTDTDTNKALEAKPVDQRKNSGAVKFYQSGIEDAVFDEELEDKQIIVLDFADERMPGGYFLENARTQEEVILFNSDGYRALLDLKYQTMDGGYILPQYGLAYIKRVRFFQENPDQKETLQVRLTDLIVAACYDLSGADEGLYKPPSREDHVDLYKRTKEKFRAIVASAVANTEGDGSNTYLLLGPIGTGAFGNDERMIAEIFCEVLNGPLMGSEKVRNAFEQIWFVSIDSLHVFEEVFGEKGKHDPSPKQ
ncbi:unnamed protein product [Adineta steineri]|uniref:Microbial-type PARG catalytic domain-containing protein n=1 Tax=Adineta steineri TaxID=433720 RepID=A0A816EXV5_9BILA|nr:unnamed protein product [Adineta steineri]CAF1535743.1 unnamed protein product [Adineta steineri]CAF1655452.1 unnamed protein product [Adineta steineri]CAF1655463.1 unnamed protein product [Adineta steineri]